MRDPRRGRVAGGDEQLAGSLDGTRRMALAGQERDEHRDELVTHELVDHAVVVEDGRGRRRVEAIQEIAEARAAHPFGERRRAPDVGEQERALDLRAAVMTGHEVVARVAPRRVELGAPFADQAHQRGADPLEGRRAHLAAWTVGDTLEYPPQPALPRVTLREELAPELLAVTRVWVGACHSLQPIRHCNGTEAWPR